MPALLRLVLGNGKGRGLSSKRLPPLHRHLLHRHLGRQGLWHLSPKVRWLLRSRARAILSLLVAHFPYFALLRLLPLNEDVVRRCSRLREVLCPVHLTPLVDTLRMLWTFVALLRRRSLRSFARLANPRLLTRHTLGSIVVLWVKLLSVRLLLPGHPLAIPSLRLKERGMPQQHRTSDAKPPHQDLPRLRLSHEADLHPAHSRPRTRKAHIHEMPTVLLSPALNLLRSGPRAMVQEHVMVLRLGPKGVLVMILLRPPVALKGHPGNPLGILTNPTFEMNVPLAVINDHEGGPGRGGSKIRTGKEVIGVRRPRVVHSRRGCRRGRP